MAYLGSLVMILTVAPGRIPKPRVAGSNPAGGAHCWGRALLGPFSHVLRFFMVWWETTRVMWGTVLSLVVTNAS
jgi:hypothetical protein